MLKIIVIQDGQGLTEAMLKKIEKLPEIEILSIVQSGENCLSMLQKLSDDFTKNRLHPRKNISASTHQGVQLVPIEDVYFFQAEDKYVIAYHTNGELLIEDSIASLAAEFSEDFVRTHRKTLVKISAISKLYKNAAGKNVVQIRDLDLELEVSRRSLPKVRKVILCF